MAEKNNFDISVVIPALNAEEYLPALLKSIEAQTLLPKEIVIVDSSPTNRTAEVISNWNGAVPIQYQRINFAYPGHARNIGVTLARYNWIAFIDCRTLPEIDWLERSAYIAIQSNAEFVGALCMYDADTHFKHILLAATYGCTAHKSLPGSLVLKDVFEQSGGFISDVRSGEDLEWVKRKKATGVKCECVTTPVVRYFGFPDSISEAISKWFIYTLSNAKIEVYNNQKKLYFVICVFLSLGFAYKWNAIFARWDERSIYYMPNITKLFIAFLFALYVFYRGIIRPLQVKVKLSYLLPWRWLEISFVGLCLDLVKAPGLLWGAILLLRRRLEIIIKNKNKRRRDDRYI